MCGRRRLRSFIILLCPRRFEVAWPAMRRPTTCTHTPPTTTIWESGVQPLQVEGGPFFLFRPASVEDSLSVRQLEDQFVGPQEGRQAVNGVGGDASGCGSCQGIHCGVCASGFGVPLDGCLLVMMCMSMRLLHVLFFSFGSLLP